MMHLGAIPASSVLYIPFSTYGKTNGESITLTGLAVTDIEIYKNGSTTQRSSDSGYALLDTDGIDFDGITGIHGFSVDLSDNTDAGFYAVGSFYWVVVSAVTIDSQTVNFIAATFRIVAAESSAGTPKADVSHWLGTAAATPSVAGVPEVDLTHVAGATTNVAALATNVDAILTDTGTTLQGELDGIQADTEDIQARLPAALTADGNIKADTLRIGGTLQTANDVGGDVDAILVDTAEIGTAGAGLTNINLPNQTMDIVGNITGNLSGSVGSVTAGVTLAAAAVQAIWDALTSALTTASSIGKLIVDNLNATISSRATPAQVATELATYDGPTNAEMEARTIAAASYALQTSVDDLESRIGTPSNFGSGATVAANLVDIEAQTDDIGAAGAGLTAVPWNAAWDAEVQSEVQDALDATLADSVPADGTRPSVAQALYMLTQFMLERSVSGTTVTVKKVDGSTSLFTLTLDDGTTPTSITRAS